jgi:hypothetical protein
VGPDGRGCADLRGPARARRVAPAPARRRLRPRRRPRPVLANVSVGGRFGGLVTTGSPATAGVPLDLSLRVSTGRVYFEGLAGPWIFFSGDTVRGHAAFGFGVVSRSVEFGGEVGWLSGFSRAMLGVRLGFRI